MTPDCSLHSGPSGALLIVSLAAHVNIMKGKLPDLEIYVTVLKNTAELLRN